MDHTPPYRTLAVWARNYFTHSSLANRSIRNKDTASKVRDYIIVVLRKNIDLDADALQTLCSEKFKELLDDSLL